MCLIHFPNLLNFVHSSFLVVLHGLAFRPSNPSDALTNKLHFHTVHFYSYRMGFLQNRSKALLTYELEDIRRVGINRRPGMV